ncbi:protein of unknown function [Paenibacillus alvei]|uniref:Adenine deaminase n=1 Tax=Paenibacillus alvei TaxID=44250 RepID=A0A383R5J1_PAEAL|nr:protein of unknown function [Paenibacillus alvei]
MVTNVSVYKRVFETIHTRESAIQDGRFLYIGARGIDTFEAAQIVDGTGKYMIPGLVDIHLHIESTMVRRRRSRTA